MLGMSSFYGWKVLHNRWDDLFAKILSSEDIVYEGSCTALIVAFHSQQSAEPDAWGHLRVLLDAKPGTLWTDAEIEAALRYAFHQYWTVVKDTRYWQQGKFRTKGGWLSFKEMIAEWSEANAAQIDECRSQFESWMGGK
jgi:hypothetical protein